MSEEHISAAGVGRSAPSRWTTRVGYAAFAWGLLFALAHAYWAFGGTSLLGEGQFQDARSQFAHDPWACRRVGRRGMRLGAIVLGYSGAAMLVVYGLGVQDTGLVVLGCGVGALGVVVALVRPRDQAVSRSMVLVATWVLGVAMIVYGCGYVVAAVGEAGSELFFVYLFTGGLAWTTGGILFVATAWLSGRSRHLTQPAGRQAAGEGRGRRTTEERA